jgi:ubiquinone/menaquinone biosynthesis C-methylase UbiE
MEITPLALTVEHVRNMSYPDLVAAMKQENTPPGGSYTLDYWIEHAGISTCSNVLDLACSTGFSSRYCYELKHMRGSGIDLSSASISIAQEKANAIGAHDELSYQVADACELPFADAVFTHILGGCNFGFIQERDTALGECRRVLKQGGIICVSNFFYRVPPSAEIIQDVYDAIGFRPAAAWDQEFWDDFFFCKDLDLLSQEVHALKSDPETDIEDAISRYIYQDNFSTRELTEDVQQALYERFLKIRKTLNEHREFQGVALQLWRKK